MLRRMARRTTPLAKAPSRPNICKAAIKWVITVPPAKRIIRRRLTTTTTTTRLGWPQEINFGRTKRDKNTPIPSDFDPQARVGLLQGRPSSDVHAPAPVTLRIAAGSINLDTESWYPNPAPACRRHLDFGKRRRCPTWPLSAALTIQSALAPVPHAVDCIVANPSCRDRELHRD